MNRRCFSLLVAGAGIACALANNAAATIVWTGPTITFSKAANADPTLPANQDKLTDNVILTRGSTMGMYNIAHEISFSTLTSPKDTLWATDITSGSNTISAANFASLTFTNWTAAYGNSVGNNIVGRNAVVHLLTDDIYLDLKFTAFQGGGTGGAFTYQRSTAVPEPSGFWFLLTASLALAIWTCVRLRFPNRREQISS